MVTRFPMTWHSLKSPLAPTQTVIGQVSMFLDTIQTSLNRVAEFRKWPVITDLQSCVEARRLVTSLLNLIG